MLCVIDASALVDLVIKAPAAEVIAEHIVTGEAVAPALLDVEVMSSLARLEREGKLDAQRAARALLGATAAPIKRIPHERLIHDAWQLRHHLSLYDAMYVALATAMRCPLVTADARLARGAGANVTVTLVGR